MIPLKQLRLIASPCARDRQVSNLSNGRFQMACVMSIALVSTLLTSLIGLGSNEGGHFFLQHTDQCEANGVLEPLFHHLFKGFLTSYYLFDNVLCMSHGYPPGDGEL
jgi:hypothetical protein